MTQLQASEAHPQGKVALQTWLRAQHVVSIAIFVVLLAIAAQVRVHLPGTPVPVTLQTAVVLLCAFCLRPKAAMAAVGAYLVIGFALAAAGKAQLFFASFAVGKTATLGYLVGFFLSAALVSAVRCRLRELNFGRTIALSLLGSAVIFGCGMLWQALATGSLETALVQGFVPFMAADLIKIGLVTALVQAVRSVGYEPGV